MYLMGSAVSEEALEEEAEAAPHKKNAAATASTYRAGQ
jgi:hypothetical protein